MKVQQDEKLSEALELRKDAPHREIVSSMTTIKGVFAAVSPDVYADLESSSVTMPDALASGPFVWLSGLHIVCDKSLSKGTVDVFSDPARWRARLAAIKASS